MEQRPGQGWRERGRVAGKQRNENAVVDTWEPSWEIRKGMKSSEWSWEWNVLLTEYERPLFFYGTVKHVLRREDDHCMKSMIAAEVAGHCNQKRRQDTIRSEVCQIEERRYWRWKHVEKKDSCGCCDVSWNWSDLPWQIEEAQKNSVVLN